MTDSKEKKKDPHKRSNKYYYLDWEDGTVSDIIMKKRPSACFKNKRPKPHKYINLLPYPPNTNIKWNCKIWNTDSPHQRGFYPISNNNLSSNPNQFRGSTEWGIKIKTHRNTSMHCLSLCHSRDNSLPSSEGGAQKSRTVLREECDTTPSDTKVTIMPSVRIIRKLITIHPTYPETYIQYDYKIYKVSLL